MKEFVEKYLKYGFNVIPVNQDKTPACDWKHFQTNKIDNLKLFTTGCLGVVCGKISDNLEVIDFDNHGGTAKENLKNYIENPLIKAIYEKYKLPIIQTQSEGYHIYYRCEVIGGNEKLASALLNGKPDTIIEIRGEGGYVLGYPTPKYTIIRNKIEDLQYIDEGERTILHEIAKSFNQIVKPSQQFKPKVENESPGRIYDSLPESIYEAKTILKNHGWTELNDIHWCRPGKNKGISATFGKVAPNVFYCFTSNSEFENEKAYTPFSIKAILDYNSDFSACAKDLAKKYNLHPTKQEIKQIEDKPKLDLSKLITESKIYFDTDYVLPTVIIKIVDNNKWLDICTLGNFSCFTGKSKARKSFASHFFMAGAVCNKKVNQDFQGRFRISMPENKRNVIYFDTEQSKPHVARSSFGIVKMAQVSSIDNFDVYCLRSFGYKDRCSIIEDIISKKNNLGLVFIDGIADLAFGNNDEEEANRVVQLLMTWTSNYDIHINTVIHQPKGSDWATGHLGSAIEKKAESVINIKKDGHMSIFEPKQMRNCEDFTPFPFVINSERLPEIITDKTIIDSLLNDEI